MVSNGGTSESPRVNPRESTVKRSLISRTNCSTRAASLLSHEFHRLKCRSNGAWRTAEPANEKVEIDRPVTGSTSCLDVSLEQSYPLQFAGARGIGLR